jgi:hypothetical protein
VTKSSEPALKKLEVARRFERAVLSFKNALENTKQVLGSFASH